MSEWISIKDKLPTKGEWVLVKTDSQFNDKEYHVGYLENEPNWFEVGSNPDDYYGSDIRNDITHWMPLSPLPLKRFPPPYHNIDPNYVVMVSGIVEDLKGA